MANKRSWLDEHIKGIYVERQRFPVLYSSPATPSRSRQRVRLGDAGDTLSGQRFLSDADDCSAQTQNNPAASRTSRTEKNDGTNGGTGKVKKS